MKIEKVCVADATELLNIYAPYVKDTAISFEYDVPSIEEFESRIQNISQKYPYIKAVENGEIVGYAYAGPFKMRKAYDYSVETTIYVRKDCKKMGIGRALYDSLESALCSMGILNMNACIADIDTEYEYLNRDSFHFHEKMGFSLVGRFHNSGYKFGRWFDMIWMEKMIGDHVEKPAKVQFGKWDL